MMAFTERLAAGLIRLSQATPLKGRGNYAVNGKASPNGSGSPFPQAEEEAKRYDDFFTFFGAADIRTQFAGKRVLDLGSGYGGRTVMYATVGRAAEVVGVEIYPRMVSLASDFAAARGVSNCRFQVVPTTRLDLPSESFDAVVSYDVLEHVEDARATIEEIHRVLVPGGRALIVFTPYDGLLNHHLDYITIIPGIHWMFSPVTLVNAVNSILATPSGARFHMPLQPPPGKSYSGARLCLPSVNGLSSAEFRELVGHFTIAEWRQTLLLERYRALGRPGVLINRALAGLGATAREAFSFNMSCVLVK